MVETQPCKLKFGGADPVTHHCMCAKKKYMKHYYMFMIRLDIDEISVKTQEHQHYDTKFVTKSSFPIKAKFVGDIVPRPKEKIDIRPFITQDFWRFKNGPFCLSCLRLHF